MSELSPHARETLLRFISTPPNTVWSGWAHKLLDALDAALERAEKAEAKLAGDADAGVTAPIAPSPADDLFHDPAQAHAEVRRLERNAEEGWSEVPRLREELRIREESQIPVMPEAAAHQFRRAEAELTEARAEIERLAKMERSLHDGELSLLARAEKAEAERDRLRRGTERRNAEIEKGKRNQRALLARALNERDRLQGQLEVEIALRADIEKAEAERDRLAEALRVIAYRTTGDAREAAFSMFEVARVALREQAREGME